MLKSSSSMISIGMSSSSWQSKNSEASPAISRKADELVAARSAADMATTSKNAGAPKKTGAGPLQA
jgi:hypothetical protein